MSAREKQARWLAKLKADPVRLAHYRERTRAWSNARYAKVKQDTALLARKRKASRESAARKRRGLDRPERNRMPEAERLRRRREYRRKLDATRRAAINAYNRAWAKANPDKVRATVQRNAAALLAKKRRWYQRHAAAIKARVGRWQNANRDTVRDYGTRRTLARQIGCEVGEVPEWIVELTRLHLNLKAELRKPL